MQIDMPAIYHCTVCNEPRNFGAGEPDDPHYQPLLCCSTCKQSTRHAYKGIAPVFQFTFDENEQFLEPVH